MHSKEVTNSCVTFMKADVLYKLKNLRAGRVIQTQVCVVCILCHSIMKQIMYTASCKIARVVYNNIHIYSHHPHTPPSLLPSVSMYQWSMYQSL